MREPPARSRAPRDTGVGIKEGGWPPRGMHAITTTEWVNQTPVEWDLEACAPDRGGNALALPIIFAFMLLAFGAGCAVGWWAWS